LKTKDMLFWGLLLLVLASAFGVVTIPKITLQPTPPPPNGTPPQGRLAATLMFTLQTAVRGGAITSGNSYVDITKATNGYFNFLTKTESITVNSNPEYSGLPYNEADELILHCSSDVDPATATGLENYDGWYYVKLVENQPVYKLDPSSMSKIQSEYAVSYTSGQTNYWGLGNLQVTERANSTGIEVYLKYLATTLASVTDAVTWVDTAAEITANATLADDMEYLNVELVCDDNNNAFAVPFYTIGATGNIETRKSYVAITTSMLAIDPTDLYAEGWKAIEDSSLYAEKGFYHEIPALIPSKGTSYGSWQIRIPVDAASAAASTAFMFKVWIVEGQTEDQMKSGVGMTLSLPTIYGFITEIGPDNLRHRGYTTSSGAGATQVVYAYVTTAA